MKPKVAIAIVLAGAALAGIIAIVSNSLHQPAPRDPQPANAVSGFTPADPMPTPRVAESAPSVRPVMGMRRGVPVSSDPLEQLSGRTNKLERLTLIREAFGVLAKGDPATALRAAKQLTDGNERETALLTLVTEWTQGELRPPYHRAAAISEFGLEAALGIELAQYPELALLWADELISSENGRAVVLQAAASAMVNTDPASAFALSERLPEKGRRAFYDAVFAEWGAKDTEAALQWSDTIPDPAERSAAVAAIQTAAPVGIGAELRTQDGYPVINNLVQGTPAQLGGQLQPGDRIVGIAQAGGPFVDTRDLGLAKVVELVRGPAGTWLHLRVLPENAPPNSAPRTVSINRAQLKFKR